MLYDLPDASNLVIKLLNGVRWRVRGFVALLPQPK